MTVPSQVLLEDRLLFTLHFALAVDNVPCIQDTVWSGLHFKKLNQYFFNNPFNDFQLSTD